MTRSKTPMNLVHLTASTLYGGPERQMLGLTAPPSIDQREALKQRGAGPGKAGGGEAATTTGPVPDVSAGATDNPKGKGKAGKADTANATPAADPATPAEETDAALVKRIFAEVAAITGMGKSQPIRDSQGALKMIAETSEDAGAKAGALQLLNLYDLDDGPADGGKQ